MRALGTITGLYIAYAYLVRFERQVIGRLSLGGPKKWGVLWPLIDAARALRKPGITPQGTRRFVYVGAPLLTLALILAALALILMGPDASWGIFPMRGTMLLAPLLGWLSLGGVLLGSHASGQPPFREQGREAVLSSLIYTLPALVALGGVVILSRSIDLTTIVRSQSGARVYAIYQPLGALLCALALLAGGRRLPYRLPGGQSDLLSDFHLQHAGGVLALYHLAEYLYLLFISGFLVTIYLGGWRGPGSDGPHWLALKTLVVAVALLWLRNGWLAALRQRAGKRLWLILTAWALVNTLLTAFFLLLLH